MIEISSDEDEVKLTEKERELQTEINKDDKKQNTLKRSSQSNSGSVRMSENLKHNLLYIHKKPKPRDPINIDLLQLLNLNKERNNSSPNKVQSQTFKYSGNPLDATQPIRKSGKHYEQVDKKPVSTFKKRILEDRIKITENSQYFRYCDDDDNLNDLVKSFIKAIVVLQEKLFKRDSLKGKIKRRYVVGIHETKKYLKVHKIKILIITTNMKLLENDELHKQLQELEKLAKLSDTVLIFSLKRRELGSLSLKFVPVCCIGILNYQGAESEYSKIIEYTTRDENNINKEEDHSPCFAKMELLKLNT